MATRSQRRTISEQGSELRERQVAGTPATFVENNAAAPPSRPGTMKRTLTPDNVFATIANVVASGAILVEAAVKPKISGALREKFFLR